MKWDVAFVHVNFIGKHPREPHCIDDYSIYICCPA
uniref:Uncharacterized protein n=1 Tax=Setaria italica TaxID=4555 RepID=K3ZG66_SETIT